MQTEAAARVERIIAPSVEAMGYDLVRVRLLGGRPPVLQVMAERRADGGMDVDDCAALSRTVSALLDVEDPIAGAYQLEVSSPGIDRPLTRLADFARWAGHEAKLELAEPREGRRRFRGILTGTAGDDVTLRDDTGAAHALPFDRIASARLVLTDALLAQAKQRPQ